MKESNRLLNRRSRQLRTYSTLTDQNAPLLSLLLLSLLLLLSSRSKPCNTHQVSRLIRFSPQPDGRLCIAAAAVAQKKELPDFPFRIRLDEADNNAAAALAAVESSSTMPQVASAFSKSVEHYRFISSRRNIQTQHPHPFIVSIDSVISGFVSIRRILSSSATRFCNLSGQVRHFSQ